MRVDAVCILTNKTTGLTPKERVSVLSRFEDEEVVAFETVSIDTDKFTDVIGYVTKPFLEFVNYDFEEFGFYLDRLIESDYFSENNPYYRYRDQVVYVVEREKLLSSITGNEIIQMDDLMEDHTVTSLQYRKMVDAFVSDFIHQFYQDFVYTMESKADLTFKSYMREVQYAERVEQFILDNRIEIMKALGYESGNENVFSRRYTVGIKLRFEKDVFKQLKKRLKQECKEHEFDNLVHRIV